MSGHLKTRDLYEVLGVTRNASDDDLKRAYRGLAKKYHPDVCPNDKEAEEKFKEAANAYGVLSDSTKRSNYDRYGLDGLRRGGPPGAGPETGAPFEGFKNVEDIFSTFGDLFGTFFANRPTAPTRGADLHRELDLTFNESVWGGSKDVTVHRTTSCGACRGTGASQGSHAEVCRPCQGRGQIVQAQGFFMVQRTCSHCQGRGRTINTPCKGCRGSGLEAKPTKLSLMIPPGVDDGQTLRISGKGDEMPGGGSGDLYITLHVGNDDRFERDDCDITSVVSISFARATLGGEIEIDTLDEGCRGTTILELSPGTQPDDLVVRRGQGIPRLGSQDRGDHLVRFKVEVPRKLSDEQAKILRRFAAELGEELDEKSPKTKKKRAR